MKKIFLVFILLLSTLFLISCSSKERLILYIPNDYIDKSVIKSFQKEENVRVKTITFDSNEVALGQIKSNTYDVIVPSDYALEELAKEGYLETLNYKELLGEDIEFTKALDDFLKQLKEDGFDFLQYSIPYFFGSIGILYNENVLSRSKVELEGFNLIEDQSIETIIYDSARDAILAGMHVNGKNIHDSKRSEADLIKDINDAEEWLKNAKGSKTSILSDEILTDMLRGTKYDAVIAYSGDAVYIMSENDNYNYYMPENTNVWADGFAIPKNSNKKELAKKFIMYMSRPETMYENSLEIGYSAIRQDVLNELLKDEFNSDKLRYAYEPKLETFQTFRYDKQLKKLIDESWSRVKAYKK